MALLPIAKCGASLILNKPANKVTAFDDNLKALTISMFDTLYNAKGIGLAANQVGVLSRVVVIDISNGKEPAAKLILVNPEIKKRRGTMEVEEGCLSVPGRKETIARSAEVMVEAQNLQGEVFTVIGKELLSQCLQHEIDHLNGILYTSYVKEKV